MAEREKALKGLRELRNLLTDDEDLKVPILDEKFLIRFVRGKKYDVKKAHETVRKYYTLRKKHPKIFKIAYPSYKPVNEILTKNIIAKLKSNDPEGRAILLWNIDKWDTEEYNMDQLLAAVVLIVEELFLFSVETQINGVVVMTSLEAMTLSHIKELNPRRLDALFGIMQGSYPLRVKRAFIVKEPTIFELVLMIAEPFMTAKFKERMKIIGYETEKLFTEVPAEILPKPYDGKLNDDEAYDEEFKQNIFKRDSYYKELLNYGFGEWDNDEDDTILH